MGACASDPVHFIFDRAPPGDAIAVLRRYVESVAPRLVVIDPLFRLLRVHDASDYARVTRAFDPPIEMARTSGVALAFIPVVFADEVLDALSDECVPVAVERVVEATPLPEFEHPERAMYLFGPENGSLDERMLERCAHVVSIPGQECSNLAAAVNVVLYDRVAKRWAHLRDAFPPTNGLLRGVRGGYEARLDDDDD